MRLLPLILLVVCCTSSAKWVFVDKTDRADHYVDLEAGQRRGDFVEAWQLTNLFSPDGDGTRSRRGLEQHDCKNRKWRLLHLSMHPELWAKGTPKLSHSFDDSEAKWERIPPETMSEAIHKFVCSK